MRRHICLVIAIVLTGATALHAEAPSIEAARGFVVAGMFYQDIGKFSQAESSFKKSLKIVAEIKGSEDAAILPVITQLAWLYIETGRTTEARRLHLQSWLERLLKSDPQSNYLPAVLETLGGVYALQRDFNAAEEMYRRDFHLLAGRGAYHSIDMASALNNLGFIQLRARHYSDALDSFSQALPLWTELAGADAFQVAITRAGLAETYTHVGRFEDSIKLFGEALPIFEVRCGPNSLRTAFVLSKYAEVLRQEKRGKEAKEFETRARFIRTKASADLLRDDTVDIHDLAVK
jgi:tetratricopeptide (TPR) repeat protein